MNWGKGEHRDRAGEHGEKSAPSAKEYLDRLAANGLVASAGKLNEFIEVI